MSGLWLGWCNKPTPFWGKGWKGGMSDMSRFISNKIWIPYSIKKTQEIEEPTTASSNSNALNLSGLGLLGHSLLRIGSDEAMPGESSSRTVEYEKNNLHRCIANYFWTQPNRTLCRHRDPQPHPWEVSWSWKGSLPGTAIQRQQLWGHTLHGFALSIYVNVCVCVRVTRREQRCLPVIPAERCLPQCLWKVLLNMIYGQRNLTKAKPPPEVANNMPKCLEV